MEADVYPAIHDNYQYFAASPLTQDEPASGRSTAGRRAVSGTSTALDLLPLPRRVLQRHAPTRSPRRPTAFDATGDLGRREGDPRNEQRRQVFDPGDRARIPTAHERGLSPSVFRQFGVGQRRSPADWYKDGDPVSVPPGILIRVQLRSTQRHHGVRPTLADDPHVEQLLVFFKPGPSATTLDFTLDFPRSRSPGADGTVLSEQQRRLVRAAGDRAATERRRQPCRRDPSTTPPSAGSIVVVTNASTRFMTMQHRRQPRSRSPAAGDAVKTTSPTNGLPLDRSTSTSGASARSSPRCTRPVHRAEPRAC